ncbi:MAG: hypothetical protein J6M59_02360 [Bacteroidaceae bacterium]|nr:hypothetical protein [Bacteroidaceae bacterium]
MLNFNLKKRKNHCIFVCSLFLLAGTVCVAGCGDDDLKEYVSVGKIENQGGEVCFDKYSKSWYLRVPVPGSVDGVMEYILRNLLTSSFIETV